MKIAILTFNLHDPLFIKAGNEITDNGHEFTTNFQRADMIIIGDDIKAPAGIHIIHNPLQKPPQPEPEIYTGWDNFIYRRYFK